MMKRTLRDLEGEYTIRITDMPEGSKGLVLVDEDGHSNVYINAHLSQEEQAHVADHELAHIINDDIYNSDSIDIVESRANGKASLKAIPHLMKARDLILPSQPPKQELSPYQKRILMTTISELDHFLFSDQPQL